jgi:hypothetical protein
VTFVPLALAGHKIVTVSSYLTTVGSGVAAGTFTAGDIGGLIGGVAAAVSLIVSIVVYNAKRNREYNAEIDEAEDRGAERVRDELATVRSNYQSELGAVRRDMEFWRGIAVGLLSQRGASIPKPPSQESGDGEH